MLRNIIFNRKNCKDKFLSWGEVVVFLSRCHHDSSYIGRRVRLMLVADKKGKLYGVLFTLRGEVRRIISFRRLNQKEGKLYEKING